MMKLMDGQKFHGGDTQAPEVIQDGLAGEPGIRSPQFFGDFGMARRKPLHMHFVDDRLVPGNARWAILLPIKTRVDDDTFGHGRGAIVLVQGQVNILMTDLIPEYGIVPLNGAVDGLGIGIKQ